MVKTLAQIPVGDLPHVGKFTEKLLDKLGIGSLQDLLFHLPARYRDLSKLTPIAKLRDDIEVVIEGEISSRTSFQSRQRRQIICKITDASGELSLRFFNVSYSQQHKLTRGQRLRCIGKAVPTSGGASWEMHQPECIFLSPRETFISSGRLTPVYPSVAKLTQARLRKLISAALARLNNQTVPDYLANLPNWRAEPLSASLQFLHAPPANLSADQLETELKRHRQRLAFEELLAARLNMLKLRHKLRSKHSGSMPPKQQLQQDLLANLGFKLTSAQHQAVEVIGADLAQRRPMLRLLQGDVGCGKTVVAACAALIAVENEYQAAIMAPTEILAEQHRQTLSKWFEPLGVSTVYLSGKTSAAKRKKQLEMLASGEGQIAIGTHALFQKDVAFANLGLAIIDEQHRFGVHQRLSLREKGAIVPHQLVMTATPIPRTLAMSAYAMLDHTVINELPPGRQSPQTVLISDSRREEVMRGVHRACAQNLQAYWVCTLIEESEALQGQAAENTLREISEAFPNLRIGLAHGRMKSTEKQRVMEAFRAGEIDLLVATTVIEVGVDVPKATVMVIDNAERLGLAQLHQLRGRIARGRERGYCILLYKDPLSNTARERLETMRRHSNGFEIAQKDLEMRGPGEVAGTRQTGLLSFRIADLQRDAILLDKVAERAAELLKGPPETMRALEERWLNNAARYGEIA